MTFYNELMYARTRTEPACYLENIINYWAYRNIVVHTARQSIWIGHGYMTKDFVLNYDKLDGNDRVATLQCLGSPPEDTIFYTWHGAIGGSILGTYVLSKEPPMNRRKFISRLLNIMGTSIFGSVSATLSMRSVKLHKYIRKATEIDAVLKDHLQTDYECPSEYYKQSTTV